MGIADREYMQPGKKRRRSSRRRPSLLDRVRFLLWRLTKGRK